MFQRFENGILVKQGKSNNKRPIYINSDGTIKYAYVYYHGFFNHGLFPHTSKDPVTNRYTIDDSTINIFSEHPPKFHKTGTEEKPKDKLILHKITADTLVLIFRDAYVRDYRTYVKLK